MVYIKYNITEYLLTMSSFLFGFKYAYIIFPDTPEKVNNVSV